MTNENKEKTPITHINEDIFLISMPMGPPMNQVNVYFLKDNDGWIMVDSGLNTPEHKRLFQDVFDNHLGGLPVKKLVVTHFHPDHIGLAGWICQKWQCQLHMTRPEYLMARALSLDTSQAYINGLDNYYTRAGVPHDVKDDIVSKGNTLAAGIHPIPVNYLVMQQDHFVDAGEHRWRILYGRGHAPAQACLFCRKLNMLISADHVVGRITPNISVWPLETNGNPLKDYLEDLNNWKEIIPNDVTILPGHGPAFTDLHARIDRLLEHHEKRIEQILKIIADNPKITLHAVMEKLFKPNMGTRNTVFALAETHAHVNHEIYVGNVEIDLSVDVPTYSTIK